MHATNHREQSFITRHNLPADWKEPGLNRAESGPPGTGFPGTVVPGTEASSLQSAAPGPPDKSSPGLGFHEPRSPSSSSSESLPTVNGLNTSLKPKPFTLEPLLIRTELVDGTKSTKYDYLTVYIDAKAKNTRLQYNLNGIVAWSKYDLTWQIFDHSFTLPTIELVGQDTLPAGVDGVFGYDFVEEFNHLFFKTGPGKYILPSRLSFSYPLLPAANGQRILRIYTCVSSEPPVLGVGFFFGPKVALNTWIPYCTSDPAFMSKLKAMGGVQSGAHERIAELAALEAFCSVLETILKVSKNHNFALVEFFTNEKDLVSWWNLVRQSSGETGGLERGFTPPDGGKHFIDLRKKLAMKFNAVEQELIRILPYPEDEQAPESLSGKKAEVWANLGAASSREPEGSVEDGKAYYLKFSTEGPVARISQGRMRAKLKRIRFSNPKTGIDSTAPPGMNTFPLTKALEERVIEHNCITGNSTDKNGEFAGHGGAGEKNMEPRLLAVIDRKENKEDRPPIPLKEVQEMSILKVSTTIIESTKSSFGEGSAADAQEKEAGSQKLLSLLEAGHPAIGPSPTKKQEATFDKSGATLTKPIESHHCSNQAVCKSLGGERNGIKGSETASEMLAKAEKKIEAESEAAKIRYQAYQDAQKIEEEAEENLAAALAARDAAVSETKRILYKAGEAHFKARLAEEASMKRAHEVQALSEVQASRILSQAEGESSKRINDTEKLISQVEHKMKNRVLNADRIVTQVEEESKKRYIATTNLALLEAKDITSQARREAEETKARIILQTNQEWAAALNARILAEAEASKIRSHAEAKASRILAQAKAKVEVYEQRRSLLEREKASARDVDPSLKPVPPADISGRAKAVAKSEAEKIRKDAEETKNEAEDMKRDAKALLENARRARANANAEAQREVEKVKRDAEIAAVKTIEKATAEAGKINKDAERIKKEAEEMKKIVEREVKLEMEAIDKAKANRETEAQKIKKDVERMKEDAKKAKKEARKAKREIEEAKKEAEKMRKNFEAQMEREMEKAKADADAEAAKIKNTTTQICKDREFALGLEIQTEKEEVLRKAKQNADQSIIQAKRKADDMIKQVKEQAETLKKEVKKFEEERKKLESEKQQMEELIASNKKNTREEAQRMIKKAQMEAAKIIQRAREEEEDFPLSGDILGSALRITPEYFYKIFLETPSMCGPISPLSAEEFERELRESKREVTLGQLVDLNPEGARLFLEQYEREERLTHKINISDDTRDSRLKFKKGRRLIPRPSNTVKGG